MLAAAAGMPPAGEQHLPPPGRATGAAFIADITAASAVGLPPTHPGRASSRSALSADISLQPHTAVVGDTASGAVASLEGGCFQQLKAEIERRGKEVDWDTCFDGNGKDRVWTAVPFLSGRPLATGQGGSKRAAQDAAATIALETLRKEALAEAAAAAGGSKAEVPEVPPPPLDPARAAQMAGLAGAPGEKELAAEQAVHVLSVYWERLLSADAKAEGGGGSGGGLEYRLLPAGEETIVELWAGMPPRAVARGCGPGRREATQRAALSALRQEGFSVDAAAVAAGAAGVKRAAEEGEGQATKHAR